MNDNYIVRPLSPLRKAIAARITETKRTIPHFRLSIDIEADALIDMCKQCRDKHPDVRPSLNDLLIKTCASALMDVPTVNVQWLDGEIRQYRSADISVVMALEEGLSAPIIRNANTKSVWEISREIKQLASAAAMNALQVHEVSGGSFSVTNLGMYGIDQFDAVINPPQCAILAVGAAKPQIVATEKREMKVATVLKVTLSADHRAIDGAMGAKFLSALKKRVEQPQHLLA